MRTHGRTVHPASRGGSHLLPPTTTTIVALAIILISAIQTIEDGRAFDISAVQVIQVYAEHIFYAIVAIGGLTGVYVMTQLSP